MIRRTFLKKVSLITALISFPFIKTKSQITVKKVSFRHVVYFWLNNPGNEQEDRQFRKNLKEFIDSMDNIIDPFIGTPAATYREVVENSYQYCLNLGFENKEEHDKYQEHPNHLKFIEKTSHLWQRVLVYDSEIL
jgi:hypothetical protein